MKKRSVSVLILVSALIIVFVAHSAWAGSPQSHRWEGVAIGIGAAILGSALYQHHKSLSYRQPEPCPAPVRPYPSARIRPKWGHWEWRREWVPATYKEVWNPGHYDDRGVWIEGHWIEIVDKPGYWTEKKVWVAGRSGRYRR